MENTRYWPALAAPLAAFELYRLYQSATRGKSSHGDNVRQSRHTGSDADAGDNDEECTQCLRDEHGLCSPLPSLDALLGWRRAPPPPRAPRAHKRAPYAPNAPPQLHENGVGDGSILVCHDMADNYHDDAYASGSNERGARAPHYYARFWPLANVFVYFSHNFVTIPPESWVIVAHRNNAKCLGTILFEWEQGAEQCTAMLSDTRCMQLAVQQLLAVCDAHNFDGYLLNVECELDAAVAGRLLHFVQLLKSLCGETKLVVWYDAVTVDGALRWQDELNEHNAPFFAACDGLFTNYTWRAASVPRKSAHFAASLYADAATNRRTVDANESALRASQRSLTQRAHVSSVPRVWHGVDVHGRGSFGGGQRNTAAAVRAALAGGCSAAVFAPAWTVEAFNSAADSERADAHLWHQVAEAVRDVARSTLSSAAQAGATAQVAATSLHYPRQAFGELPFATNFDRGYGARLFHHGRVLRTTPWHSLALCDVQRSYLDDCETADDSSCSVHWDSSRAWCGGGCISVSLPRGDRRAHLLKLFCCAVNLDARTAFPAHTSTVTASTSLNASGEQESTRIASASARSRGASRPQSGALHSLSQLLRSSASTANVTSHVTAASAAELNSVEMRAAPSAEECDLCAQLVYSGDTPLAVCFAFTTHRYIVVHTDEQSSPEECALVEQSIDSELQRGIDVGDFGRGAGECDATATHHLYPSQVRLVLRKHRASAWQTLRVRLSYDSQLRPLARDFNATAAAANAASSDDNTQSVTLCGFHVLLAANPNKQPRSAAFLLGHVSVYRPYQAQPSDVCRVIKMNGPLQCDKERACRSERRHAWRGTWCLDADEVSSAERDAERVNAVHMNYDVAYVHEYAHSANDADDKVDNNGHGGDAHAEAAQTSAGNASDNSVQVRERTLKKYALGACLGRTHLATFKAPLHGASRAVQRIAAAAAATAAAAAKNAGDETNDATDPDTFTSLVAIYYPRIREF